MVYGTCRVQREEKKQIAPSFVLGWSNVFFEWEGGTGVSLLILAGLEKCLWSDE